MTAATLLPVIATLALVLAAVLAILGLFAAILWLLDRAVGVAPTKYCPGCGMALERWNVYTTDDGQDIAQEWFGCPNYRNASWQEQRKHYARWNRVVRTSPFDPRTGKPRT